MTVNCNALIIININFYRNIIVYKNEYTFVHINIFISNNILINYHEKILYIIKYLKIFNNIFYKCIISKKKYSNLQSKVATLQVIKFSL